MNALTGFDGADAADWISRRRAGLASKAIRAQFGETMLAMAADYPAMVAVTSDLMYPTGMAAFGERYPERLINVGIAEQNATGIAAGLALCGKLPVVCGYAAFTTLRAVEQAKVDCAYNGVKVILVGQSAGLSYGVGGPSHQTFEDLAIMRAIPNMTVVAPADASETDAALRVCLAADAGGPIYLRLGRGPEPVIEWPEEFALGRARRLRDGNDLCLVANGPMVAEAMLAADYLAEQGISAEVINIHTLKPLDAAPLRDAAERVRGMIVIEEHGVFGGLGSAVLEALDGGHAIPVRRLGIGNAYPPIGPVGELRAALGLSALGIVGAARELLQTAGR